MNNNFRHRVLNLIRHVYRIDTSEIMSIEAQVTSARKAAYELENFIVKNKGDVFRQSPTQSDIHVKRSQELDTLLSLIETDKDGDGFICREAMAHFHENVAKIKGA